MDYINMYMIVLGITMLFTLLRLIRTDLNNKFSYLIGTIILFLFNLSIYKFSGDYIPYISYLDSIQSNLSFNDRLFLYNYEKGFALLCWGLKLIFGNSNTVYLVLISIPSIILFISFYLKSKIPLLSLCIYIAHFHWWMGIVLIRQLYALVFVLLAINYLFEKRSNLYYCVFIIIASLFHNSALVLLLLPIYVYFKLNVKKQIFLIVASFILGQIGVLNFVFEIVFSNISRGSVYANYLDLDRGLNYLAYIEKVLIFLFLLKYGRKLNMTVYNNNLLFYSFALIVCGLLFKTEVASRLLSYFDMYTYIYIVPLVIYSMNLKQRVISSIIILPYLYFYLYRFISITINF